MKQVILNSKFISEVIDGIEASEKRDKIESYVLDVTERCAYLCESNEIARALNELKLLFETLKAELDL